MAIRSAVSDVGWALQIALENARIEFFENRAVTLHHSTDGAGIAVSPGMPNEARRIYPQ